MAAGSSVARDLDVTFADGRIGRIYRGSDQSCGHPLAARMVEANGDGTLRTVCWSCKVEATPQVVVVRRIR